MNKLWISLEYKELKKFIGVLIYMGIINRPRLDDYWSNSLFGNIFIKKIFKRDRFMEILHNIHFELEQPNNRKNYKF